MSSHVHHVRGRHATANRSLLRCGYTSTTSLPRSAVSEKVTTYNPRCDATGARGFGCWDFNGAAWRRPCGNDRKLISIIEEAFADTNLPVPPGPTPLGYGLVYVGLSSHRAPMISGRYAYTVRFLAPTTRWVARKKIKAATRRCGCISLMPTLEAIARCSTNTPRQKKKRAHWEQSDHSRNSKVIHMTSTCSHEHNVKGPHNNVYAKALDSLFLFCCCSVKRVTLASTSHCMSHCTSSCVS